ncbi:MAG: hypothetical protein AMJ53_00090 [Gammaproteobacteria bacterium SG8_11]|nr:MAG: hypothetical protein AMJ53_00090 [Gammaproteobacteria bacterium SG8_11]
MKWFVFFLVIFNAGFFALSEHTARAQDGKTDWNAFSKNLVKAFSSDNEGLQRSSLQLIIEHADSLKIPRNTVLDIVSVYRYHEKPCCRRLAMIALSKIQNGWAMDFLKRNIKYETDVEMKKQLEHIVFNYYGENSGLQVKPSGPVLAEK